jgi:hypothetical protein
VHAYKNDDSSRFVGIKVKKKILKSGPPIRKEKDKPDIFREELDRNHKSRDSTSKGGHTKAKVGEENGGTSAVPSDGATWRLRWGRRVRNRMVDIGPCRAAF